MTKHAKNIKRKRLDEAKISEDYINNQVLSHSQSKPANSFQETDSRQTLLNGLDHIVKLDKKMTTCKVKLDTLICTICIMDLHNPGLDIMKLPNCIHG